MRRVRLLVERYPERTETFVSTEVAGLRAAGLDVVVESLARPGDPARGVPAADHVWEDETTAERLRAVVWLVARHPVRVLRDLTARRRWRREEQVQPLRWLAPAARRIHAGEEVLHAHFAWSAALQALRLHRLLGVPYSVTAHANDIYAAPANLCEKLEAAVLATTGCEYTARTLRQIAPSANVEIVVMGIDPGAFTPGPPREDGRRAVLAVGRLVEKKGFADLIRAAGILQARGRPLERVTIAGDGPLRVELEKLARDVDAVAFVGAVDHEDVDALLAQHDLLAMPCVVARRRRPRLDARRREGGAGDGGPRGGHGRGGTPGARHGRLGPARATARPRAARGRAPRPARPAGRGAPEHGARGARVRHRARERAHGGRSPGGVPACRDGLGSAPPCASTS